MNDAKTYIYGTLLALPLIGIFCYFLNPPECPSSYTQQQVDTVRCIVGANIGGRFAFISATIVIWAACIFLVNKIINEKDSK